MLLDCFKDLRCASMIYAYDFHVADIIEDLYSPRTASMDFVSELVRKRGKENLPKFIHFIVEIFKRYTNHQGL